MTMRSTIKRVVPKPLLRLRMLLRYGPSAYFRDPASARAFVMHGLEVDNFTYDIANRDELTALISTATATAPEKVRELIAELDTDVWLAEQLQQRLATRKDRPSDMPFGRRIGWYVVIRLLRPSVVVETGVHDGLGSAVILRALERNASEGAAGTLVSFDVDKDVGWLIPDEMRSGQQLVIGDSIANMSPTLGDRKVGVFIHDSLHTYDHETREFEAVIGHMAPGSALISDNAHACTAMEDFCKRHQLTYARFLERPIGHWYPGAGLGLAVIPKEGT